MFRDPGSRIIDARMSQRKRLLSIYIVAALLVSVFVLVGAIQEVETDPYAAPIMIDGEAKKRTVDYVSRPERARFIQRVYALVSLQIAATCMISVLMMQAKATFEPFLSSSAYFVAVFGNLIALLVFRFNTFLSFILVISFTILMSLNIGRACVIYSETKGVQIVIRAFVLTLGTFIGLTVFTMYSTTDYEFLGPFCFVALQLLIFEMFFACFGQFNGFWPYFGVLTFCGYIIYDTNQICRRYSTNEFVLAALDLYLDALNLFLQILKILGDSNKRRS